MTCAQILLIFFDMYGIFIILGFHVVGYLFLYFAACINPIIYVIMNKQYRQAYASVICCSKIRASLTPRGSSAPGQTDFGQGNHHPVKVSTLRSK